MLLFATERQELCVFRWLLLAIAILVFFLVPGRLAQAQEQRGYIGVLVPRQNVEIIAPISSKLLSVGVYPGEYVNKGDVIARLDDAHLRQTLLEAEAALSRFNAEVVSAEAGLNLAVSKVKRRRKAPDAISREEMDAAVHTVEQRRAQLAAAKARVLEQNAQIEQLKTRLKEMALRAPIDGLIASARADTGSDVRQGESLFRIISKDNRLVRFAAPPDEVKSIRPGATLHARIGSTEEIIQGTILHVSPAVDRPSGLVFALGRLADVPQNAAAGAVVRVWTENNR